MTPLVVFLAAAAGLAVASHLLVDATEDLAAHGGPRSGGLATALLGGVPAFAVLALALWAGLLTLAKAAIAGCIVADLLVVLGLSAVVGGLRHGTQYFDREAAGRSATMMILALVALSVPPLFAWAHPVRAAAPLESLSQAVAVLLLCVYFLAVYYSLYWDIEEQSIAGVHRLEPGRSPGSAAVELVLAAALVVWLGKVVVDNLVAARLALGLSEEFVAVIVLPLLTTVAGNSHALAAAWQNRMDVSVAVASGSATRTAMFLAPLLVFASSALGHPMNLSLGALELGGMLASALVAAFVAMDGQSSWIEGVMLLAVYVLEAVALLWWPAAAP